ncbi:MAG: MTAP family purine nucleoside phosphorylase [Tepidisphaeraceae bacterium]|jgi:5'-methylthioadenosine phosphorylase
MSQTLKVGLIGGTGLADLLRETSGAKRHEMKTPFGAPSDAIFETDWENLSVLLLGRHGPGHTLNPSQVPFRANIFALKQLGCTHILASGAVGSLRQELKPTELAIADQVIDKTRRAATFFEKSAVHVEFAEPFCPVLRKILIEEGQAGIEGGKVHDGACYVCMEGPQFSTRAESLMHRMWGGDLIGMTVMPEAKLAREAEIPYALIALITDYDCWKSKGYTGEMVPGSAPAAPDAMGLLNEILANLKTSSSRGVGLMRRALRRIAADPGVLMACPARNALELAIWSDKSRLDEEEKRRLWPLWGKYLG